MKYGIGIIIAISICLVGIIPYANSFHNPFIWDEEVMIAGNPIIKNWGYLPQVFKSSVFGHPIKAGGYYRPVYVLSFMLNYHFFKLDTFGYHLFNIIFHILNAWLLYILILNLGLQKKVAWLSGLLFVLFPVNCQAVTLIGGRIEILFGLLSLLCIIVFLNGIKKSNFYFLLSILFFALTLFTKESALILPFILLAYSVIFLEEKDRQKTIFPLLALMGIVFIYCGLRFFFLGSPFNKTLSLINEASFTERALTFPRILLTYVRLIVFPLILKSEYHFVVRSFKDVYVWLGAPLLLLIFTSIYRFLRPRKQVLFFSLWFLLGVLPYANIALPLHATLMEHWVYFSSMAFAALMALAIFKIREGITWRWLRYAFTTGIASLMLFYTVRIIERNKQWSDPFVLYQKDAEREPNSFLLHCNLGVEYFRRGMMKEAKKEFMASIEASPGHGYDMAYNNIGVVYAREGNLQQAISSYRKGIALNDCLLAYQNLGALYNSLNMHEEAVSVLEGGARLYPMDVEIKYQLAVAYYKSKRLKLAEQAFREVEDLQADYSQTKIYLDLLSGRASF